MSSAHAAVDESSPLRQTDAQQAASDAADAESPSPSPSDSPSAGAHKNYINMQENQRVQDAQDKADNARRDSYDDDTHPLEKTDS